MAKNGWYPAKLRDKDGQIREYNVLYQNGRIRRKILAQNTIPTKRDWRFYDAKSYDSQSKATKHENLMKKHEKKAMHYLHKSNIMMRAAGESRSDND